MGINKSRHQQEEAEVRIEEKKNVMLFMGIENTGKTTFLRQITQSTGKYNSEHDKEALTLSLFVCTIALIEAVEKLKMQWSTTIAMTAVENIKATENYYSMREVPQHLADSFITIWTDPIVSQLLRNLHKHPEVLIYASTYYYAKNIQKLLNPNHTLTENDRMAFRMFSTGIVEQEMEIKKQGKVEIVRTTDIGGGYRARFKWRHVYEYTKSVVFFVNLTHFYMTANYHRDTPRMVESLEVFETLADSKWLPDMPIMFVLTHGDVLQEQLKVMTLDDVRNTPLMENYNGQLNVKNVAEYILDMYLAKNKNESRQIGYLYADAWLHEPVIKRYLTTDLHYRGINDPKQVSFATPFTLN